MLFSGASGNRFCGITVFIPVLGSIKGAIQDDVGRNK
jgi:hypothetical protein